MTDPRDGPTDLALRGWWNRRRRVIIPAIIALLVAGAFLAWGPVGLGNGPLTVGYGNDSEGWGDAAAAPVALSLPIYYSGHDPAVVDGIDAVGGTRYPAPRITDLEVVSSFALCGGLAPARRTARGFVVSGCGGGGVKGSLLGSSFGAHDALGRHLIATAQFAAPRPGQCWVLVKIAVHYHIGIRHYTASGPVHEVVCATGDMGVVNTALTAVDGN